MHASIFKGLVPCFMALAQGLCAGPSYADLPGGAPDMPPLDPTPIVSVYKTDTAQLTYADWRRRLLAANLDVTIGVAQAQMTPPVPVLKI